MKEGLSQGRKERGAYGDNADLAIQDQEQFWTKQSSTHLEVHRDLISRPPSVPQRAKHTVGSRKSLTEEPRTLDPQTLLCKPHPSNRILLWAPPPHLRIC